MTHDNQPRTPRQWAVVLGASEGSGAAIARDLAQKHQLDVFGVHRNNHPIQAQALADVVTACDQRFHQRLANAGTPQGAAEGADELLDVAGPRSVRVFVHAVADASYGRYASGKEDQLHHKQITKTFDRMAHSFVYWTQELLARDLLAEGARLIALSNSIANMNVDRWGLVVAAKAALEAYTNSLALELTPRGYRVLHLKYNFVETRAVMRAFSTGEWQRIRNQARQRTHVGRVCTVEEVASFIGTLLGPAADWFSGTTIDFTGGIARNLFDPMFNPGKYKEAADD